jgi:ribosomal protein S27E
MLKVKCPKCGKEQNYLPRPGMITEKSKRCVYCGHTFKIHSNQEKSRIIKVEK